MANIIHGDDPSCGIKKRVLHASRRELPEYPDGTRVGVRYVLEVDIIIWYIASTFTHISFCFYSFMI